jgi:nitroreductase
MPAQAVTFEERPSAYPAVQTNGAALKDIHRILLERRATSHFLPDAVPEEYLRSILQFGAQAPSGFNLQPWRFVVARESETRERLRRAAMGQEKVREAPVVIVAFGMREEWKGYKEAVFQEGARRGLGSEAQADQQAANAAEFIESIPPAVWLNRHTMIALTVMMLVAEAYGLDTAPMEGFDPEAVREALSLPDEAEVVALLAIGYGCGSDKPYPGRFSIEDLVFEEEYGRRWTGRAAGL